MNKSTNANVVHLDQFGGSSSSSPARASVLLDKCRDFMVTHLKQALPAMLDKVDDSLFEMADKADTNQQQTLYFEAMREVRLKRAVMEERFVQQFIETATKKTECPRRSSTQPSLPELDEMPLVLLDDGDLEESLAVQNMVSKIRTQCGQELFALEKRMAALLDNPVLESEDNPIGPESVCESFKQACEQLESTIEIKLVILKLYDKFVIGEIKKAYEQLNQLLIQNNVLPSIRTQVKRSQAGRRQRPDPCAPQGEVIEGQFPSFNTPPAEPYGQFTAGLQAGESGGATQQQMFQLLHHLVYGDVGESSGQNQGVTAPAGTIDGLTELQRAHIGVTPAVDPVGQHSQAHPGTSNVLRELKTTSIAAGMAPIDNMMIDVVAMMFDYILDDQNIPAAMKALIGRLQIPVLKVSIVDKRFFASKSHPARRLLNTLGNAAAKWNDKYQRSDAFYATMEKGVQRILEEFTDNVELFAEVLEDFEAYLAKEETQAGATAEQSASDIEIRDRLNLGRQRAQQEIEKRLKRRNPIAFVRDFLVTQWKELLVLIYVEQSEAGEGWRAALDTMDDLLWSIAPKPIAEDRNRLVSILPRLIGRVKSAMQMLAMPAEEGQSFLTKLATLHLATVNQEQPAPDIDASSSDASEPPSDPDDTTQTSETADQHALLKDLLGCSFKFANDVIHITATERTQCRGMGTTLLATQFERDRVTIGHVGDSRLYGLRNGRLKQITSDHSLQQAMISKGYYTVEQAREKIGSHILARAVGAEDHLRTDVLAQRVQTGDVYLLCSDGLTDMVQDTEIQTILGTQNRGAEELARELVERANYYGGQDNISVIVARILSADEDAEPKAWLDLAGFSDVGRKRAHNEDSIGFDANTGLAVLADGMGGCQAGEVASALAMNIVLTALRDGSLAKLKERASELDAPTAQPVHEKLGVSLSALWKLFCDVGWVREEAQPDVKEQDADELGPLFGNSQSDAEIEHIEISSIPRNRVVEDEYTELVKELEVGSWVEFKNPDGTKTPARLSWISPISSTYLFTDRRGLKVADPSLYGLASEFRRGSVTVAEAVPLFERAVSNLGAKLRGNTAAQQPSPV